MTDKPSAARRNAQSYLNAYEQRETVYKKEMAKERAAVDARTAKLRALRLAKEEADREAAALLPPAPPKAKAKPRKKVAAPE